MANALTLEDMSPGLAKGVERAQREPTGRFHALAHLIDVPALTRTCRCQRSDAAGKGQPTGAGGCGGAQLWDADETKKWVLAASRGRSIMAAEWPAYAGAA